MLRTTNWLIHCQGHLLCWWWWYGWQPSCGVRNLHIDSTVGSVWFLTLFFLDCQNFHERSQGSKSILSLQLILCQVLARVWSLVRCWTHLHLLVIRPSWITWNTWILHLSTRLWFVSGWRGWICHLWKEGMCGINAKNEIYSTACFRFDKEIEAYSDDFNVEM